MAEIQEFLNLVKQTSDPASPLADVLNLWLSNLGNVESRLHSEGDPGTDATYRLIDAIYGVAPWQLKTVPDGSQTITLNATVIKCTPDENTTFVASGGYDGMVVIFMIDNTAEVSIAFSTGFTDVTTITDAGIHTKILYYDGTAWREVSLAAIPTRLPRYGEAFPWVFKMVLSSNFATPKSAASPAVTISKDTAAFASLTGSPSVTEIGFGWYAVTVPASDMTATVIVLKATATSCAQQDVVYYLT